MSSLLSVMVVVGGGGRGGRGGGGYQAPLSPAGHDLLHPLSACRSGWDAVVIVVSNGDGGGGGGDQIALSIYHTISLPVVLTESSLSSLSVVVEVVVVTQLPSGRLCACRCDV